MFISVGLCLSWWTLTLTLIILDITKTFIQCSIVYNTMMITLNHNSLVAMWWWEVSERQGRTLWDDMKESANKLFQKWKKNQTSQVRQLFWEVCWTCNCNKLGPIYKLTGPHHGLPPWWFIQLASLTCFYPAGLAHAYRGRQSGNVCVLSNWDHSISRAKQLQGMSWAKARLTAWAGSPQALKSLSANYGFEYLST